MLLKTTQSTALLLSLCATAASANPVTLPIENVPDSAFEPKPLCPIHQASKAPAWKPNAKNSQLKMFIVHRTGKHNGYSTDVRYPQFRGGTSNLANTINKTIKKLVDMNVPAEKGFNRDNEYSCDFTPGLITPNIISLRFEFYNWEGGAHGATCYVPLNLMAQQPIRSITLRDALVKPTPFSQIANLCATQLTKRGLTVSSDVLTPKLLANYTISESGLTFTFPEGLFTPYAAGAPTVTITFAKLRQLLPPRSILLEQAERSRSKKMVRAFTHTHH